MFGRKKYKTIKKITPKQVNEILGYASNYGCEISERQEKYGIKYLIVLDRKLKINNTEPRYLVCEPTKETKKSCLYTLHYFNDEESWGYFQNK